jgi:DNA-binding transcriptional ArsR family regulator
LTQHPRARPLPALPDRERIERTAALFRGLGDPERLSLLLLLRDGEVCVSELADAQDSPLPTISQRLKILEQDGLVRKRRDGRHVLYGLFDDHVRCIVEDGLVHGAEPAPTGTPSPGDAAAIDILG